MSSWFHQSGSLLNSEGGLFLGRLQVAEPNGHQF